MTVQRPPQLDVPDLPPFDSDRPDIPPVLKFDRDQVNGERSQRTPERSSSMPKTNGIQKVMSEQQQQPLPMNNVDVRLFLPFDGIALNIIDHSRYGRL